MRYRLPDGCAGVTLAGTELTPGKDRTIEAEAADAATLAPHGIVPADSGDVRQDAPSRASGADRRMLR